MATIKRKSAKIEGETREQAFVRLAEKRVSKAIGTVRLIGNLGSYPHTAAQTARIVNALKAAVDKVEYQFGGEAEQHETGFSLSAETSDDEV